MLLRCTVQLACKLGESAVNGKLRREHEVSAEHDKYPTVSVCAVSGELPLVPSAEGNKRPALLEKFLVLWSRTPSPPLHLLFSEPTLTAIFSATDSEVKPLS